MKKIFCPVATLAVMMLSFGAEAQPRLNTEQYRVAVGENTIAIGGDSEQKLAQTFTASRTGFLTHLTLPIGCAPLAELTVVISDAPGGMPGTAILASETISGEIIGRFDHDDDDVGPR